MAIKSDGVNQYMLLTTALVVEGTKQLTQSSNCNKHLVATDKQGNQQLHINL